MRVEGEARDAGQRKRARERELRRELVAARDLHHDHEARACNARNDC